MIIGEWECVNISRVQWCLIDHTSSSVIVKSQSFFLVKLFVTPSVSVPIWYPDPFAFEQQLIFSLNGSVTAANSHTFLPNPGPAIESQRISDPECWEGNKRAQERLKRNALSSRTHQLLLSPLSCHDYVVKPPTQSPSSILKSETVQFLLSALLWKSSASHPW